MKFLNTLFFVLLITFFASAHSGRTDGKGGHHDRSNGVYHYHHGRPAPLAHGLAR